MRAPRLDMIRHARLILRTMLAAALIAVGCAKSPPLPPPAVAPPLTITAAADARVSAPMTIAASADTNPDATGRPSPVVVRVYQLRTDAGFTNADFFPLFDDEQKVLGQELISRDEFMLAPSERRTLNVTVAPDARFVGAIAAFRDIQNAQWRGIVPAPKNGLTVSIERARVVLTPAAK